MNRAKKRRNKKLSDKATKISTPMQAPSPAPATQQQKLAIQQAIDLGLQHHNAGDLPKAEGIYQQILQAEPKQPFALHFLGVINHQKGKSNIAADLIGQALAIKPDYAEAHNNLGLALQELEKLDDAVASYHKALTIKPDFSEARYNLGNAFLEQGKLDDAVASYHKALAIKHDYAEAHSNLGNALKEQGKLDDAITSYRNVLNIRPGAPETHSNLGLALKELGNLDDAVACYRKALTIKPNYAEAHYSLGNVFLEQGRLDEAVASYREALAIKSDYTDAHRALGDALQKLGKLDDAIASYNKALAIKPDYAEAHNNLGVVFQELGNLDDAIASYNNVLAITPDCAEAHSSLGNVFHAQGKLDDAAASHRKALTIKPSFAQAHYNLGNALHAQGELDDAVASYRQALTIKPSFAEAHSNLGNILFAKGELDDAVASYRQALTIKPSFAEAWNNLKFLVKIRQFSGFGEDGNTEVNVVGLNAFTHADAHSAIQQFYLEGFRPHEADESFEKVIAALPTLADEAISINERGNQPATVAQLPDKIVALFNFGRSGTGLLHSLIDGHPDITTLPGVYLRGYFNEGVWGKLSANGWRQLPERFAEEFAVLFDARISKPIPSRVGESPFYIGKKEGMTVVGENRDEFLSLDKEMFCNAALRLMEGLESIDPKSFLMVVHAAFEEVNKSTQEQGAKKQLCFYHIHNPDGYALPNFLRYAHNARLLMTVREPIQNCESWLRGSLDNYSKSIHSIFALLFGFDQIPFRMRESVGVRLEDIKTRPEATIEALCAWLGVEVTPSLYEMTAQGKNWWGNLPTPKDDKYKALSAFDDAPLKRPVGAILSEKDQFILRTLFYPFSVRFGYREADQEQFQNDLKEIRPFFDDMLDFEKAMAERLNINHDQFRQNGSYQLFRAGLVDRWDVLNELGDYPHMLTPLSFQQSSSQ